ncbi:hypothetical protein bthur0009_47450 [Bacillus thuringiensis serovar andalousiensis BGSC 4AW1]|nr:hypothetical protein bthur0009_47450 [Bacillus thuringiensis serovar andalousiensis BGSC 4AW1]
MACSEQEGVGSPDEEALFASQEGVKRPTVLATEHSSRWNWIIKKVEASRSQRDADNAKNGSNKGL